MLGNRVHKNKYTEISDGMIVKAIQIFQLLKVFFPLTKKKVLTDLTNANKKTGYFPNLLNGTQTRQKMWKCKTTE